MRRIMGYACVEWQTRVLRQYLLASIGDEALATHRIVVGDPSSFQVGGLSGVLLRSTFANELVLAASLLQCVCTCAVWQKRD